MANETDPSIPPFSAANPGEDWIEGWEPVYLPAPKNRTHFTIVEDDARKVLRIDSDVSYGSLVHRLSADPRQYPILRWSWRIAHHNPATRLDKRSGDDYPARLYVLFDYDEKKLGILARTKIKIARKLYGTELPAAALCYVWDPTLPVDTSAWNAYADRLRMIVTHSGSGTQWAEGQRDIYQDFKNAFGEEPPRISGIAVGGDSDNTKTHSEAYIGDVTLTTQ